MTEKARADVNRGKYEQALAVFPESSAKGSDELLILMERGTLLQAAGEFEASSKEFGKASEFIKDIENRAVISASQAASQTASLLVNEKVIPYEGQDFEKVMIRTLDALNYLMLGDLDGARVEIRNSYRIQQYLYDKHYKKLEKAKKDSGGVNLDDAIKGSSTGDIDLMKQTASSVASIYQNAFAYYISSIVYELNNEQDESYIDLKKANQAVPNCRTVQNDLARLARYLGYRDDVAKWQSMYGKTEPIPKDYIDIILIFELGIAPCRQEIKLTLPIPSVGLMSAAFPVYEYTPSNVTAGYLSAGSKMAETSIVSDTDAIASRNLLDDYPILIAKQAARAAIKGTATREAGKQYGDWAQLAVGIASAITEQADLRTWTTLPKQFQIARIFVPKGTAEVTVSALPSLPGRMSRTIAIPDKTTNLVLLARASDSDLRVFSKSFSK